VLKEELVGLELVYARRYLIFMVAGILLLGCNDALSSFGLMTATTNSHTQSPPAVIAPPTLSPQPTLDEKLRSLIASHGLTGDPSFGRNLPSINSPKAQLGMKLFFTKALGGSMDTACASCHHPMLGSGDALSLSIGAESLIPDLLGPGRQHATTSMMYNSGTPPVPRNAQPTFNAGLWDKHMFHDGRIESAIKTALLNGAGGIRTPDTAQGVVDPYAGNNLPAAQARFPVGSPVEMRGFVFEAGNSDQSMRNHIASRFQGNTNPLELPLNNWLTEFRAGFNDPAGSAASLITFDNMMDAIGEYERSQLFINNPWRQYIQGDNAAISQQAKDGALLFFTPVAEGGANCFACHAGDFFTDEQFHVVAMPQVGRGKGDFNGVNWSDDYGRFRETLNPDDKYAFRTPTLLNVEVTGPWGHAGGYTTLDAVVRHYISPQAAFDSYDVTQLSPSVPISNWVVNSQLALTQLASLRANGSSLLVDAPLSDIQVSALLAFLNTLTDPCVKSRICLAPWIPDSTVADPDGLRLNAINQAGLPL